MSTWALAVVLRPVAYLLLFVLVVAPLEWLLFRMFPEGRLKVALFRVRSGAEATRRDAMVMSLAVILSFVVLIGWIGHLAGGRP